MNYIVTKPLKNKGLAIFLAILFGSIGLFYSTIMGGIIMTLLFPVIIIFLFLTGHFIASILLACSYYMICMIWAIIGVSNYNRKIQNQASVIDAYRNELIHTGQSRESNYYDEYRKSLQRDSSIIWMIVTVLICGLLFYLGYKFKYLFQ